jgi:hypothetical protein
MQRVREDLSAVFGSMGRPVISTFVCWACAALAYPLAKGGYAGTVAAAIVLSGSVLLLAYLLGSAVLAFVTDAKRSCLPGAKRLARHASLLTAALLLPGFALAVAALAGNPIWPAWVPALLLLAIALVGVLAQRRPASALGLLGLIVLAACWAAHGGSEREQGKEWYFALLGAAIVLAFAAVPLLAAVTWRRLSARSSSPQRGALKQAAGRVSRRLGAAERPSPVRIVRTCLGGTFARVTWQWIGGAVLLAFLIVAAIGLPQLGANGWLWVVSALALVAAGWVSAGFLAQISRLTREQIAELALMPGLGAPAAQRRALCHAVVSAPLRWLGLVLLLGSVGLLVGGQPISSVGVLAICMLVMWLTYIVLALQKLAALPPRRQSFISEFMLLYVVVYGFYPAYAVRAFGEIFHRYRWAWAIAALLAIGITGAIAMSLRRLATAPHPFLS